MNRRPVPQNIIGDGVGDIQDHTDGVQSHIPPRTDSAAGMEQLPTCPKPISQIRKEQFKDVFVVACDVDGTLLKAPDQKRPDEETIQAVREYEEAGGLVVICTARGNTVEQYIPGLEQLFGRHCGIFSNGAHVVGKCFLRCCS